MTEIGPPRQHLWKLTIPNLNIQFKVAVCIVKMCLWKLTAWSLLWAYQKILLTSSVVHMWLSAWYSTEMCFRNGFEVYWPQSLLGNNPLGLTPLWKKEILQYKQTLLFLFWLGYAFKVKSKALFYKLKHAFWLYFSFFDFLPNCTKSHI